MVYNIHCRSKKFIFSTSRLLLLAYIKGRGPLLAQHGTHKFVSIFIRTFCYFMDDLGLKLSEKVLNCSGIGTHSGWMVGEINTDLCWEQSSVLGL